MAVVHALRIALVVLLQVYGSQQACYLGGDIAFILDISEAASDADLYQVKLFGKEVADFISNNGRTLMALLTYRCEALLRFSFDDWTTSMSQKHFMDVVENLRAIGNQTHHGMSLLRQVFSKHYGARAKSEKVAILVTDRPSSNIMETQNRAARLKADGVIILVIAIGNAIKDDEIQRYAVENVRALDFSHLEVAFNMLKNIAFDCAPCLPDWIPSKPEDGTCYRLITTPMPWKTAQDHCNTMGNGSRLVMFESNAQVDWFLGQYTNTGLTDIWVGLRRHELTGEFTYADLIPLDETIISWADGFPTNGACVHYGESGLQDDNCDELLHSVCQMDMKSR